MSELWYGVGGHARILSELWYGVGGYMHVIRVYLYERTRRRDSVLSARSSFRWLNDGTTVDPVDRSFVIPLCLHNEGGVGRLSSPFLSLTFSHTIKQKMSRDFGSIQQ